MIRKQRTIAFSFLILLIVSTAIQGLFFSSEPLKQNIDSILVSPCTEFWFGTDSLGRSLFWRVLAGAQVSLLVGVLCPLIILFFGGTLGLIAGWKRGWTERLIMRFSDLMIALPSFLLVSVFALGLSVAIPASWNEWKPIAVLILGIAGTHWMIMARVIRAQVKELRDRPFVEAAEALGGHDLHIFKIHLIPNLKGTLFLMAGLQIPTSIMYESFMSFIGLGVQAPQTSWGILIKEGWQSLAAFPHLILIPSAFLFLTIWSFHIVLDEFSRDPRSN